MPITLLDLVLLVVMLISGLLAMVRGFMREILSIAAWGAAALVTLYAFSKLLPTDAVYFGEISLSGAIRPVAQTAGRLKEAAKLGFGRAVLPESARADIADAGLSLNSVGGLTTLVAEIAARGSPRGARDGAREGTAVEKIATPARFRRENG